MPDSLPEIQKLNYVIPAEIKNRIPFVYQSIEVGIPDRQACAMAGIEWVHFNWLYQNMPEITMAVDAAKGRLVQEKLRIIANASLPKRLRATKEFFNAKGEMTGHMINDFDSDGDWRAAQFVLERTQRNDFAPSINSNITHKHSTDISGMISAAVAQLVEGGATIIEGEIIEDGEEGPEEEQENIR